MRPFALLVGSLLALMALAHPTMNDLIRPYKREALQNIVTWDEHSLFIHGERVLIYSGSFHPFRLPVPSLWKDVFEKIKAMGFNCVSFYVDWALLEGERGVYRDDGIFAIKEFMDTAQESGVYLIARPGPYINAETAGGGFPGWLQRVSGVPRTTEGGYLNATDLYMKRICETIATGQITEGGPVILFQPENEYTFVENAAENRSTAYFQYVEDQARNAGIVVPLMNNDVSPPLGYNAPGTGEGSVDIYGHDSYPLGFSCASPTSWPQSNFPTDFAEKHLEISPDTPYAIPEYQGGSVDDWGGSSYSNCAELVNAEAVRLLYGDTTSFGIRIQNIYMTYGGTNWGNLGQPNSYTSYDYGAPITEDRLVSREKYSATKLIAHFLRASPAYLTSEPLLNSSIGAGAYTGNDDLYVTQLLSNETNTRFFVIRHTQINSDDATSYRLDVPSTVGQLSIPRVNNASLTLNGRDSKTIAVDYDVGGNKLLYSTAEILTWKKSYNGWSKWWNWLAHFWSPRVTLVVYGGENESHELAFKTKLPSPQMVEGDGVTFNTIDGQRVLSWTTSSTRRIVRLGKVFVYILDRNSAYNYWEVPYATNSNSDLPYSIDNSLVMKAGYLIRSAVVSGNSISLVGDVNQTTTLEIIAGAPKNLRTLKFNGNRVDFQQDGHGVVKANLTFSEPNYSLPKPTELEWKYIDSLPELENSYDDSLWTTANLSETYNPLYEQVTYVSLYSSDYGYNTGSLFYRGHFTASGNETDFSITVLGGRAHSFTAWINGTYLGAWNGTSDAEESSGSFSLPSLSRGKNYVLNVAIDHMGMDMQSQVLTGQFNQPRGIYNYTLSGHKADDITWKLTGNLGGESYVDKTRGPLNECGFYFNRKGYHQPKAPVDDWKSGSPTDGLTEAGVRFYYSSFDLDLPEGYDIPLSFVFDEDAESSNYRALLYINGYQFGRYVSNIGPQKSFPVPEGILDYRGTNYIGIMIWATSNAGGKITSLDLNATSVIQTGLASVSVVSMPAYSARENSY